MPTKNLEYRIFFGRPAGLEREESSLKKEIQGYNRLHADSGNPLFRLQNGDHTPPGVGRPQARVNKNIVQADYLILTLYDRWGSDTGVGGYTSGTLEELATAIDCLANPNLPMRNIAIFFREVDPRRLRDPGPQLKKVLSFMQALTESRELHYKTFRSVEVFRRDVKDLLSEWSRECKYPKTPQAMPAVREWIESEHSDGLRRATSGAARKRSSLAIGHIAASATPETVDREGLGQPISPVSSLAGLDTTRREIDRKSYPARMWGRPFLPVALGLMIASLAAVVHTNITLSEPRLATVVDVVSPITRGGYSPRVVDVAPTRDIVLISSFFGIPDFESYRFELAQQGKSFASWGGITAGQIDQFSVILPRSGLPAGKVSARLYGVNRNRMELIQEHHFEVRYH